jgi:DNA-binding transcriptional ArsR family regulator
MDLPVGLRSADAADVIARRDAALEWLDRLDPASDRWEIELSPVTSTIVEAALHNDAATLETLVDPLRLAVAGLHEGSGHAWQIEGYLRALLDAVAVALQRLPDPAEFELLEDSQAGRMLEALQHGALTSAQLQTAIGTGPSQLSRVGRTLLAAGLLVQRRAGRVAIWEIAPRGRQLLERVHERRRGVR